MRLAVVGTSSSGKTTLAAELSERINLPHFDLDNLYWGPEWTPCPKPRFRDTVRAETRKDTWICSGNYSSVRDLVLGRATHIVWLDYPLPLVFSRAVRRTLSRLVTQRELFNGNRERWTMMFSPDWIPWWVLRTHRRRRREYPRLFRDPAYASAVVIQLKGQQDADRFLADPLRELRP